MKQFERVPINLMQNLQPGAGIVVDAFNPATGVFGNILGATDGGIEFDPHPNFEDYGDGIDNLPPNTMQLKRVSYYEPHLTGTFKTVTAARAVAMQPGSAFAAGSDSHIIPGSELNDDMFADVWLLADYSDKNIGAGFAGYIAIHLKNALNVLGFRIKTNDEGKGDFAFDYLGHYDLDHIDDVPFEMYIKQGTAPTLATLTVTSASGASSGKSTITVSGYTPASGESYVYQTAESTAPGVSYGQSVSAWTALTSGSDITPPSGHTKITVVSKDASGKAVASGTATLVVNT